MSAIDAFAQEDKGRQRSQTLPAIPDLVGNVSRFVQHHRNLTSCTFKLNPPITAKALADFVAHDTTCMRDASPLQLL